MHKKNAPAAHPQIRKRVPLGSARKETRANFIGVQLESDGSDYLRLGG